MFIFKRTGIFKVGVILYLGFNSPTSSLKLPKVSKISFLKEVSSNIAKRPGRIILFYFVVFFKKFILK